MLVAGVIELVNVGLLFCARGCRMLVTVAIVFFVLLLVLLGLLRTSVSVYMCVCERERERSRARKQKKGVRCSSATNIYTAVRHRFVCCVLSCSTVRINMEEQRNMR